MFSVFLPRDPKAQGQIPCWNHTFGLLFTLRPAQSGAAGVALSTEEATAFIKGKSHSATRLAGGTPSLQFKDNGTMYGKNGNNGGGSDSGKWRIEDGKLCMSWQRWEYEGCGQLVRVEGKVQHLYPNASAVHLVFNN